MEKKHRPPIVTLMGHVDHGKTSLLDTIRQTDVVSQEVGGITQHIGASQITVSGRKITFIDTPGHEAFTKMRARGGHVADIVVLVVAADEGVKEQTLEAISHAKAAGVPIIVAINKVDLPTANINKVKEQLAEANILVEDWGGDTVCVPVSAKTKEGIKELLEMILLVADLAEPKNNLQEELKATVIESYLDNKRGSMAVVIVTSGSLNVSDQVRVDNTFGKVKALISDKGEKLKVASLGDPVEVLGLRGVPEVGSILQLATREKREVPKRPSDTSEIFGQKPEEKTKFLNLILKVDSKGSQEAIQNALLKLETQDKKIKFVHVGVGNISESDVLLASATEAVIFGFHVKPQGGVEDVARNYRVEIKIYKIIYELMEAVERVLGGLIAEEKYEGKGFGEILKIFVLPSGDKIVGVKVDTGQFKEGDKVKILRGGEELHRGEIRQIRIKKDRVRRVNAGNECGVLIKPQFDFKDQDVVEILS